MAKESHNSTGNYDSNYLELYTEEEIKSFDDEQIDIAYEHSIAHIKEIFNNTKIINTRATLLLGYLLGALALYFSQNLRLDSFLEQPKNPIISFILIEYIVIIGVVAIGIVRPAKADQVYIPPKNILTKDLLEYNKKENAKNSTRLLKFSIIKFLQTEINNSIRKQNIKYIILNICILFAFAPLLGFAIHLLSTII